MRFKNLILYFLISIIQTIAFAGGGSCLLTKAIKDPELANNESFWADYSNLSNSKQPTEKDIEALVKKHKAELLTNTDSVPKPTVTEIPNGKYLRVSVHHKGEKEIAHLPENLHKKVDEFISKATKPGGIQDVRNNPSRWHLEKLPEFGENSYSVRLNGGYRILFEYDHQEIVIKRVNKGQIHGS